VKNMVSISADDLDSLLKLSGGVSDDNLEAILDLAIDTLNLFGAAIDNLTGDPATVTVTSKERGAVFISARAIYYAFYKGIESAVIAGQSITKSDIMSNTEVMNTIRQAAKRLEQHEGVPFVVGEATS
jgi:hypothetical protein